MVSTSGVLAKTVFFFVTVCLSVVPVGCYTTSDDASLRTAILTGYDAKARPYSTTDISLTFVITSLGSIDVKSETMGISGWFHMAWNDSRLTWTPATYGSITDTFLFEDDVWSPVLVVYNSINDLSAIDQDSIPLRISYTGDVAWNPPGILTVSCNTDITYFPFDTQECAVQVRSFGYTASELTITSGGVDTTYYSLNGEWNLKTTWTTVETGADSIASYWFRFKRKPAYYGLNLILPIIMFSFLSVLIFVLPAESGEKMGYSVTLLLTFVVFILILGSMIPTTSDSTSFFEVYVILILAFNAFSVILSIFNLAIYHHPEDDHLPNWAVRLTLFFKRKCCWVCKSSTAVEPLGQSSSSEHTNKYLTETHGSKTNSTQNHGNRDVGIGNCSGKELGSSVEHPSSVHVNGSFNSSLHVTREGSAVANRGLSATLIKPRSARVEPGMKNDETECKDHGLTWKEMASVYDGVFLRAYVALVVFLTILFTFLMVIN